MYAIILNLCVKCKYKVEEDFRFALKRDRELLMIPFKFTCLSIYQEKHSFVIWDALKMRCQWVF